MRNNRWIALGAVVLMLMTTCCKTSKGMESGFRTVTWKMVSMGGETNRIFAEGEAFTVTFSDKEGKLSGMGACNRFFGTYKLLKKGKLSIGMGGATRMACPDMNAEQPFFTMLSEADGYRLKKNQLVLLKGKSELAVFVPLASHDRGHNAANSLDYWGKYEGTLPAADCPGIQTVIELMGENQFSISMVYVDRQAKVVQGGTYELKENLLTLNLPNEKQYYRMGENRIIKLDMNQQPITGNLAPMYVLTKSN